MKNTRKNQILCLVTFSFLLIMGLWLLFRVPDTYSLGERRTLASKPELTMQNLKTGKLMTDMEAYTMDQFPKREMFRGIKAVAERTLFLKQDSNGIYASGGHLSKIEYPLDTAMLSKATERMKYVYDNYMKEKNITPYLAIVPDKNYYLAEENNRLALDYEVLYEKVLAETTYMNYIEIKDLLMAEAYYYTDTHWRQECIVDVAERIGGAMGMELAALQASGYKERTLERPFYGVYYGQAALPARPDTIKYLTNDVIEGCVVTSYDTGKPVSKSVYDMEKAEGKDAYEMFLTGACALLTIENEEAASSKELVVFRDSFASSLIPFFIEGYQKITVIDLRYIRSDMVGAFVSFEKQDVLFLYSTLMLNRGLAGGN